MGGARRLAPVARWTCGPTATGGWPAYKQPRLVRVVDSLPRNALGKVVRSRLG